MSPDTEAFGGNDKRDFLTVRLLVHVIAERGYKLSNLKLFWAAASEGAHTAGRGFPFILRFKVKMMHELSLGLQMSLTTV